MKKVSIIIPCYNVEKYVEQCIESAINQTYENIEVIAIDNESTDSTFSKILNVKQKYPQLIVDTAPNIYKYSWDEARSKGLELCTGDYITFICSDDFLEPFYIENCIKYMQIQPDKILAIQSAIRNIQDNVSIGYQSHFYQSMSEFKKLMLTKSVVNTPTVIYNIELHKKGLLETRPDLYLGASDYDSYCRLADNNVFIYPVQTWLGYNYRWHPQQCTWGMHKEPISYDKLIQEYWKDKWKQT